MSRKRREFAIRSLSDIYELPTDRMVEQCLSELADDMIVMRRTVNLLNAVAQDQTPPVAAVKWKWPDEITWTPDSGGESKMHLAVEGQEILTVGVTHKRLKTRFPDKRNVQ